MISSPDVMKSHLNLKLNSTINYIESSLGFLEILPRCGFGLVVQKGLSLCSTYGLRRRVSRRFSMADEIIKMCGNLKLSEEETIEVTLPISKIKEIARDGKRCLVGELIVEKAFNKEAFRRTMASLWGQADSVAFHEVGKRLFIIKFS